MGRMSKHWYHRMVQCVWEIHRRERQDRGYALDLLGREICESKLLRLVSRD
jgi:hypothetical protein